MTVRLCPSNHGFVRNLHRLLSVPAPCYTSVALCLVWEYTNLELRRTAAAPRPRAPWLVISPAMRARNVSNLPGAADPRD